MDIYGKLNPKSKFCLWIKIVSDPFARFRGFSLLSREMLVYGGRKVKHKVLSSIDNKPYEGNVYPVAEDEWLRVVPEMRNSKYSSKYWFVPAELALEFTRPRYNKVESYGFVGLENNSWYNGKTNFGKSANSNGNIPNNAKKAADEAYYMGLR